MIYTGGNCFGPYVSPCLESGTLMFQENAHGKRYWMNTARTNSRVLERQIGIVSPPLLKMQERRVLSTRFRGVGDKMPT